MMVWSSALIIIIIIIIVYYNYKAFVKLYKEFDHDQRAAHELLKTNWCVFFGLDDLIAVMQLETMMISSVMKQL